jgi:hypothetical protein
LLKYQQYYKTFFFMTAFCRTKKLARLPKNFLWLI